MSLGQAVSLDDLDLIVPGYVLIIVTALTLLVYFWALRSSAEAPVPFYVAPPDAVRNHESWSKKAEVLENPAVRIRGSTVIQCYAPATGRLLGRVNPATANDIDRCIAKAKNAQAEWSRTSFAQRRQVLQTLLKYGWTLKSLMGRYILDNQDNIVRAASLDSGKPRVDASLGEVLVTAEKLHWTIKHGEKALRPERRPNSLLMMYKHNEVRYEPLGVVAALVSWNYPFHNILNGIISAIFAGNAIIVKAAEATAWSAEYFIQIVKKALAACGYSSSLVQLVICWPNVASHLTSHPDLKHITFIGSQNVAKQVAADASMSMTPLCLELGGKDPAVILDDLSDSKLQQVASILMRGVFQSAGQNCIGIERVIALPRAYERLLEVIPPRVRALRVGSALDDEEHVDMGACISDANFDRLEHLINSAVKGGARLLHGGKRIRHERWPSGHYFMPTMLVDVTTDMEIANTELFAPVFLLMRAASVDDAIKIANSSIYDLGASVFGTNQASLERVTSGVRAGMVAVNDFASYYMCSMPFGGVRGSGSGRFGGPEGLRALCNIKSVTSDTLPAWTGVSTAIPPRLDYPLGNDQPTAGDGRRKARAWEFVKGIVEVGYGQSLAAKIGGIMKIIRNS